MAEEKKEPWLNYLALTTVILAVCATLATFKGGGSSTRSVLNQSHAANQWAYYQSKSIKGYIHEAQKDNLEFGLKSSANLSMQERNEYLKKIEEYKRDMKRYDDEKAQIQKDARKYETMQLDSQKHAQVFGIAVIFLQIAILLSSIAALLKKKPVWIMGLALGGVGLVYFASGFLMFLPDSLLLF